MMFRYGLIGFAAAIIVAASLVPDDALARRGGGGGGYRGGGGARVAHVGGVGRVGVAGRGYGYHPAARVAVRNGAYGSGGRRGVAYGVGAAAVGAAAAGAYGYYNNGYDNNSCYTNQYGQWICPQY
jgi:hypothetical protein